MVSSILAKLERVGRDNIGRRETKIKSHSESFKWENQNWSSVICTRVSSLWKNFYFVWVEKEGFLAKV